MKRAVIAAAALLVVAVTLILGSAHGDPLSSSDAKWYADIAEGDIAEVIQPFSGRVLYPFVVRLLSFVSGLSIDSSFFVVNTLALFGFVFVLFLFFSELPVISQLAAGAVIFSPLLLELSSSIYLPELFYSFLVAVFFYMLKKNRFVPALLLLFALCFTRPLEGLILGAILAVFSLYKRQVKLASTVAAVALIAFFLTSQIGSLGLPNIHNIGNFKFLILKPIFNVARSVLGIDWLTNTMVQYCEPSVSFAIPPWIRLGDITSVGICGFNIMRPLTTIFFMLTTFGVVPLALILLLRRRSREIGKESELWLLTALGYGVTMFLLGSLVSYGGLRTLGYGWPAFWLAALYLFDRYLSTLTHIRKMHIVKSFLLIQTALVWIPYLVR